MLIHNQQPDRGSSRTVRCPQPTSAVVLSCGALISTSRLLAWSALPRRRGLLMAAVAAHAALQQQQPQPVRTRLDMRATSHNTRHLHNHCSRQQQGPPAAAVTLHEHQQSEGANASTRVESCGGCRALPIRPHGSAVSDPAAATRHGCAQVTQVCQHRALHRFFPQATHIS